MSKKIKAERFARSSDIEIWITPKKTFIPLFNTHSVRSYPHSNINDDCNDRILLTKKDLQWSDKRGVLYSSSKDKVGYQYVFDPSTSSLYTSLGFTYERKSFPLILTVGILLIFSIVISSISQLVLVIRTLMTFRGKKNRTTKAQTLLELSASILLIGIVTFLLSGSMENVHKPNAVSITLFITTACLPILTIVGTTYLIREKFMDRSVINKSYLIGLAISLLFTSFYLCYWDIFAFRIWSY